MRYVLQNKDLRAAVSQVGGELCSLEKNGQEYLWQADPAVWAGTAPVLFPIVGKLREDRTSFAGVPYKMPRHGFARKQLFTPKRADREEITLSLEDNPQTREMYPYAFDLEVAHLLNADSITTRFQVTNKGNQAMPFSLGGHPGFACPFQPEDSLEDYQLIFEKVTDPKVYLADENGLLHPDNYTVLSMPEGRILPLSDELFRNPSFIFKHLEARQVSLCHKRRGEIIRFNFENFANLVIWRPEGFEKAPLCIEPWQGLPSSSEDSWIFEEKDDLVILPSHQSWEGYYRITLCQ